MYKVQIDCLYVPLSDLSLLAPSLVSTRRSTPPLENHMGLSASGWTQCAGIWGEQSLLPTEGSGEDFKAMPGSIITCGRNLRQSLGMLLF